MTYKIKYEKNLVKRVSYEIIEVDSTYLNYAVTCEILDVRLIYSHSGDLPRGVRTSASLQWMRMRLGLK